MNGALICDRSFLSTMTVLDFKRAVHHELIWPLRVASDGNIYTEESFLDYYGVSLGTRKWNLASPLFPANHFRFLTVNGRELCEDTDESLLLDYV